MDQLWQETGNQTLRGAKRKSKSIRAFTVDNTKKDCITVSKMINKTVRR